MNIVLCTCPDRPAAERLATGLVSQRLAACVNCVPGVVSTYRWEGEVRRDQEVLLVIKTVVQRLPALKQWLQAEHPYDVPEIVVLEVSDGSAAYLDWVSQSCQLSGDDPV